jgi:DNA-binding CsgD family transcriptional regulator
MGDRIRNLRADDRHARLPWFSSRSSSSSTGAGAESPCTGRLGASLGSPLSAGEASIEALCRALTIYSGIGASWDALRVRSRLRALGVRRRIATAEPETHGWAALTAAEIAVARLVAERLTNRDVADRLFLSPHTVNSHVRHVFTKLRINSRVELVRFVSSADVE